MAPEPIKGRFKKGQSGNPGGRPKGAKEIRDLALKHCPAAMALLAKYVTTKQKGVSHDVRVRAAQEILNRGVGKAIQPIDLPPDSNVASLWAEAAKLMGNGQGHK